MKKLIFDIEGNELLTLKDNDSQMAKLISLIGGNSFEIKEDRFSALIRSIIGQQLSAKAAATISSRFFNLIGSNINPYTIGTYSDEAFRDVGISKQKIKYIRDLCSKVSNKEIDLSNLDKDSDSAVIETLTKVKGIGLWTAEMFLIFSLGRIDILSLGDVGLQRACKWLYGCDGNIDNKILLREKGKQWAPYRSIASLYLWDAIDYGFVESYKNIDEAIASKY
ncbi:DNA-3-methyladenine glycosylase family protein [Fredinandcohnia onubensis]|uniref:DNA-3-methyladenine glycosylase family protein n=1 Tax=Fredinandcohnia onubensis TaxID=1571209 RepID=UPI000C0BFCBC|nr:DNA-3-methyladenine glycosylase [Fredinandcohnia onubensis]